MEWKREVVMDVESGDEGDGELVREVYLEVDPDTDGKSGCSLLKMKKRWTSEDDNHLRNECTIGVEQICNCIDRKVECW